MSFALELAQRANSIFLSTVPTEAVEIAKRALADTIGVALAGCQAAYIDELEEVLESNYNLGPASKIGRQGQCTVLHAALINGTSVHALDFDDCSTTMGGHPSAPVVPAILALAQQSNSSGAAIIEAYLTGIEVETRLARGVLPHHYEKGWHPTATLGVFGAAAASARMLGFNDTQLATTLAIAVSMASGLKSNFGTPIKSLHVGQAAHNGLLAALTTANGMTANHEAFEHNYGFFRVFNGEGTFSAEKVLDGWDGEMEILNPGIAIKQHPCCGSAHSAIDAAIGIFKQSGPIRPDQVAKIETWTHERRLAHTNRPNPRTGLDAKFSVQFLTVQALLLGQLKLADFDDVSFLTADAAKLLAVTTAYAHQDKDQYFGRVRVTLKDGSVLEHIASTKFGRGSQNPMSLSELETKFSDCAKQHLSQAAAHNVFEAIMTLDKADNIHKIMQAVCA